MFASPSSMLPAVRRPSLILLADDDEDDRLLVREALAEAGSPGEVRVVPDGAGLLAYLNGAQPRAGAGEAPRPGVVLLDLNMPGLDGRETLRRIRADPALRALPVVVFTTSRSPEDVAQAYALGANTVITKPPTFAGMVDAMRVVCRYWFEIAALPPAA